MFSKLVGQFCIPTNNVMRVPVIPQSCQNLVLSVFSILALLVSVLWYHVVVLIYISPMTNDIEYLFTASLAIYVSSIVKCPFRSYDYL